MNKANIQITTNQDELLDFEDPGENKENLLQSITEAYYTDLICEGPIEGFCDKDGELIEPNFILESSELSSEEIALHNATELNQYLKAFYVNDVPIMDEDGKINYDEIEFDFSLNGVPTYPGKSLLFKELYTPRIISKIGKVLVGPKPVLPSDIIGNYPKMHARPYTEHNWLLSDKYAESRNPKSFVDFENAVEKAKSYGASSAYHVIENTWIQDVVLTFTAHQITYVGTDGATNPYLLLVAIRVKNEGEEYQNPLNYNTNEVYHGGNRGKIPGYPDNNIWISAGPSGASHGEELLHVYGLATSKFVFDVPIKLPPNPRGVNRVIEVTKITHERFPNKKIWKNEGDKKRPTEIGESSGESLTTEIELLNITEINPFRFNYPYSVIINSKYDSQSFSQQPNRSWHLKLKKVLVPSNYNPSTRIYSGFWDGSFANLLQWTDNPAWIFYDLATNPVYGLGKYGISEFNIDKWTLYKIAKYCDELVRTGYSGYFPNRNFEVDSLNKSIIKIAITASYSQDDFMEEYNHPGKKIALFDKSDDSVASYVEIVSASYDGSHGSVVIKSTLKIGLTGTCSVEYANNFKLLEPRFSCNLYITQREEALKVLSDLVSIFSGMMYWINGKIFLTHDAPKDVSMIFNNSNVIGGGFEYSGSAKTTKFSVVKVSYLDSLDNFTRKIEYVEDSESIIKYGYLDKEITGFGCTSRGQAHRLAKWTLYSLSLESEVVNFRAGVEAAVLRPGDVIKISDKNRLLNRLGGRVNGIDVSERKIYLDSDLDINLIGSTITIINPKSSETHESLSLVGDVSDDDIDHISIKNTFQFNIIEKENNNKVVTVELLDENSDKDIDQVLSILPIGSVWIVETQDQVTNYKSRKYRIVAIAEDSSEEYGVIASEYREDKFSLLEKDFSLNNDNIPSNHVDPQFSKLTLPNPPSKPFTLSKIYDTEVDDNTILSGTWLPPEKLPIDSNGDEVSHVDYVVDYYYNGQFHSRQSVIGSPPKSIYSNTINIGGDYGYYTANVFSEYNGAKSRNFITNSINVEPTGAFLGYEIIRASFKQNALAASGNPAGIGTLGEFSSTTVDFSWQVKDNRFPNSYLSEADLFTDNKYRSQPLKYFDLTLKDENGDVIDTKPNLKKTSQSFLITGSRTAILEIVSVAQSGNSEVRATGYISGKNYEPQITSFSTSLNEGGNLQLSVDITDSDFHNVLVYRTGIPVDQELAGGDFAISNDLIVAPEGDAGFTTSGVFNHDLNKTYFYKLLPVDSFGTGVLQPITGLDEGLLAFDNRLQITDLSYSVNQKNGDFSFYWNLVDSLGDSVDVASADRGDVNLLGFNITLEDDESSTISPNPKTIDTIRFRKDTRDVGIHNRILVSQSDNLNADGSRAKNAFIDFYKKDVPYSNILKTTQKEFTFSNFLSGGPSPGIDDFTTEINRIQHGIVRDLGVRYFLYELGQDLPANVLSGDILYTNPVPITFVPENASLTNYTFTREKNNLAYSAVHSGGFSITNNTGENLQTTSITKNTLAPTSGKRSIDFEVKLLEDNDDLTVITSARITGSSPAPRLSNTITFDPIVKPGSIVFKNIDYSPGQIENDITRVEIYTGDSENFTADEEHFAFSIKGPYGTNSNASTSDFSSDQNVIVHENVPHGIGSSQNYKYHFLPYDQFGSGEITKNIAAYVINPYRMYDHLDFTAPNEVSSFVVNGGFGRDYNITWTDNNADNKQSDINQDVDHYEIWKTTGTPFNTLKSGDLPSDFPNQNFVALTANAAELVQNPDPSGGIINAQLLTTTADRNIVIKNNDNSDVGYFWIRTVDKNGNKSKFYPDGVGQQNKDKTIPLPPTGLSISSSFKTFYLNWSGSIDTDVREYEIWKSSNRQLQTGLPLQDATDDTLNTGYIYLDDDDQVIPDPWTGGSQQLVGVVPYGATTTTVAGATNETASFWIRAVDFQNNKSKFINSVTGVESTLGSIVSTDIDDFAVNASKTFSRVPVLEGENIIGGHGAGGTCICWNSHMLYYSGSGYCIEQGYTQDKFVWWKNSIPEVGGKYKYICTSVNPMNNASVGWDDDSFQIFTNEDGGYDVAWNAIANQVIGTAAIESGSIVNAHIDNLSVTKLTAGIISGQDIEITSSVEGGNGSIKTVDFETAPSGFALSGDGTFHFKGGNASLKFDNNGRLELIGSFINSSVAATLDDSGVAEDGTIATFIGGGYNNNIETEGGDGSGIASSIVGGGNNYVEGRYSSIVGGIHNTGLSNYSFIGGGLDNVLSTGINEAFLYQYYGIRVGGNFIGAGRYNNITSFNYSSIVGGYCNLISGNGVDVSNASSAVSILGGSTNCIIGVTGRDIIDIIDENDSDWSVIVGGNNNLIFQSTGSFIGNGNYNKLCHSDRSSIVNGEANCIIGLTGNLTNYNTINNGRLNKISSSSDNYYYNTIINGQNNQICNGRYVAYLGGHTIVSTGAWDSLAFGRDICLTENSVGNLVFADTDYLPRPSNCIVKNSRQCNSATFYFCCGVYFENTKACSTVCFEAPVICSTVCFEAPVVCASSCLRSSNRLQAGYECSGQYVYPLLIHNCSLETCHSVGMAFCNRNDAGTWCASSWWRSSLQNTTAGSECSTLEIERRQNGSAYKVLCSQPNGRTYMDGAVCARGGVLAPSVNAGNLIVQDWYVGYNDKFKFCTSAGPIACISSVGGFTGIYSNYDVVAYSDCRGKSNIATIDNALDKVNKLQGRIYNRNDIGGRHYGLVAQEVAEVIPELAFSGNNGDTYGVKYQNTVALLIEAIKEQNVKISGLEQKIKDLL